MKKYVLDACAIIAVLNKETGAESVREILEQAKEGTVSVAMHKINLLEVYYGILRECGESTAERIIASIHSNPIEIIDKLSEDVFKQAGHLKAHYRISLADSIVLAVGMSEGAIVVSSDHHEFDAVEKEENVSFLWIR